MLKEAFDDFKRYKRDNEANQKLYKVIHPQINKDTMVKSRYLKVGDIIEINANQRIPADVLLLYTTEKSGQVFLQTDQLDGETDWKLRQAVTFTQEFYEENNSFIGINAWLAYNKPNSDIYQF